jgi:hypothetical protein
MADTVADVERTCAYLAEHVRREAPRCWVQGPRRPALDPGPDAPEIVRLFATRDIYRLPRSVSEAVAAWARGERDVELLTALPTPRAVLALQARGRRCVSLLADADVPAGPIAGLPRGKGAYGSGGLAFAVHDLCHLEKLHAPGLHHEQVGFFGALEDALGTDAWREAVAGFDAGWEDDCEHVLADMNGSSAFLFVVLRNKLKLAVRRALARERGAACRTGALDDDERALYDARVVALVRALGLDGAAADAARGLASRHEAELAAGPLCAFFEARGRASSASQASSRTPPAGASPDARAPSRKRAITA